jgi:hypothetical protein
MEVEQPKENPNKEILETLRNKLRNILDEPLTASSLLKIQRMAQIGHEIVILEGGAYIGSDIGLGSIIGPMGGGGGFNTAIGTGGFAQGAENYGANVMREIMSLANKYIDGKNSATPAQLVQAIVIAREHGEKELADKLEKELLKDAKTEEKVV